MTEELETPRKKSGFVSLIAWVFILVSVFVTLYGAMGIIGITLTNQAEEVQQRKANTEPISVDLIKELVSKDLTMEEMLLFNENLTDFLTYLIWTGLLLVGLIVFLSSRSLLMRKNWARKFFIVFFCIIVLTILGSIYRNIDSAFQKGLNFELIWKYNKLDMNYNMSNFCSNFRKSNTRFCSAATVRELRSMMESMQYQGKPPLEVVWGDLLLYIFFTTLILKLTSVRIRSEFSGDTSG